MVWLGNRLDGIFGSERHRDVGNLALNIIPRRFDFICGQVFRERNTVSVCIRKGDKGARGGDVGWRKDEGVT